MSYAVHEIFYTLQGEGAQTGRASVFCRFQGCNLWNGLEASRATAACTFCDTVFIGDPAHKGGKYPDATALADTIEHVWNSRLSPLQPAHAHETPDTLANHTTTPHARRFVVFTGGEPLLQLDDTLIDACHARNFTIAIETNGSLARPRAHIDWVCVSPKPAPLAVTAGDELKLVFPQSQPELHPTRFDHLAFTHRFLQPLWSPDPAQHARNTALARDYCLANPAWRLSLQTHKILGIP